MTGRVPKMAAFPLAPFSLRIKIRASLLAYPSLIEAITNLPSNKELILRIIIYTYNIKAKINCLASFFKFFLNNDCKYIHIHIFINQFSL